MRRLMLAMSVILFSPLALAQNAQIDKDAIISVLQQQRNSALDQAAVSATQLMAAQKELADLKTAEAKAATTIDPKAK